jgi:hypothetical protein
MRRQFCLLLALLLGFLPTPSASAAGKSPILNVNCGQILGSYDQNGTYGLFKPDVTVKYYGSPLKVTSYFYETSGTPKSDTGQNIITFTDKAPSTRYFVSKVDIQQKVLEYGQPQTGYFKFVIEVVDSLKRKTSFTCLYKDYRYSTAFIPKSGSTITRGFNRSTCSFDTTLLYGKVEIVDYGQDFKVQVVDYGQNLKVQEVSYGATSCGKWELVDYGADFKIKLVDYGADFKIKLVEYGAGA